MVRIIILILFFTGCSSLGGSLVEEITLPNGNKGLTIDCTGYGWSACFKSAGEACKSGYAIHERSMEENTKSELKTEPLTKEQKDLMSQVPIKIESDRKDKYMVISCK